MNEHYIIEQTMNARAAIKGAADMLEETSMGQAAILSTLLDEGHELNDFQREGLLVALQGLTARIGHRASHLQGCLAEHKAGDA